MSNATITFSNTALPLILLGLLAAALPYLMTPRHTRSQVRVALLVGLTGLTMFGASAFVFALFDTRALPQAGMSGAALIAWFYLRSSLVAAFVWVPVLLLAWLGLAQRVERRRGEDLAREQG